MRFIRGLIAFACLPALLPAVSLAAVSLGTNLGLTIHHQAGEPTTVVESPSSAANLQPGLRIGFSMRDPRTEFYINTGFSYLSHYGSSSSAIEVTGNFQSNFSPEARTTPYLTAGAGLLNMGSSGGSRGSVNATSMVLGGGLGISRRVAERHGRLRMEVRYDLATEASPFIGKASMFGVRLGFDLWME